MNAVQEVFGDAVFTYTRQQSIDDGMLVDVSNVDGNPFKYPVAMTDAAFRACVSAGGDYDPAGVLRLPNGQSLVGRMHNVFWMMELAARKTHSDTVFFRVLVDVHGDGRKKLVRLWSKCGPGDTVLPVITIMLEGDD